MVYLLYKNSILGEAVLMWMIPSRLAIMFLAFSFDYLPHSTNKEYTKKDNKYLTTSFLAFPFQKIFDFLLFFQTYHVVHHVAPTVPFYKYTLYYLQNKSTFVREKVPTRKFFSVEKTEF